MRMKIFSWIQLRTRILTNNGQNKSLLAKGIILILAISTIFALPVPETPIQATQIQRKTKWEWAQSYGGESFDGANSIFQTADGFIVTGWTQSFGEGENDALLVILNANGEVQWHRTYGGPEHDASFESIETDDNNVAFAGYTESFGAQRADFWLTKTDNNGQVLWGRRFGGPSDDVAHSITQTPDGFVLVGYTRSGTSLPQDVLLAEFNTHGTYLKYETYGGSGWEDAYSIIQTTDDGFAIAGYTTSYGSGGKDAWLLKLNKFFVPVWGGVYGGQSDDEFTSVLQTADGGYILAGHTKSRHTHPIQEDQPPPSDWDAWLVKINAYGAMEWSKTYGGDNDDGISSLIQTSSGFALIAHTQSFGAGEVDYWLIKTDISGNLLWNETYGGPNTDAPYTGIQLADGSFVLAGSSYSFGADLNDVWVLKTPPLTITGPITEFVTLPQPITIVRPTTLIFTLQTTLVTTSFAPMPLISPPESPLNYTLGPEAHIEFPTEYITVTDTDVSLKSGPTFFNASTTAPTTSTTFTSAFTSETIPSTSQAPAQDIETQSDAVPGFVSLPALLGLVVVTLVFIKRRR